MENKYYTPDISEFHVGFEYELKYYPEGKESWKAEVIDNRFDFIDVVEDFDTYYKDSFRVKYLDQEDIAECVKENTNIDHLAISYNMNNLTEIKIYINGTTKDDLCFKGICKNKSELKKLLKQIGIDYVEA